MNSSIYPCLWFAENAKTAADFYCHVFSGEISAESEVVVDLSLFGQKIMLLNGGPYFKKNASVSFTIIAETEEEVELYWKQLSENGIVLMPLDSYPWSKKYGWVKDQYDVTWQLYLGETIAEQKIVPTLMFLHENNGKAESAMELYTSIFLNSKIKSILYYDENKAEEIEGNVQHAYFSINDYAVFCMDSSYHHPFDFNEGISLVVMTESQEETNHLWDSLVADGGEESRCGWLKDKFGLIWQIVPKRLIQLMHDKDREKAQKVVEAMMKMQKIDIDVLENAFNS